MMKFMLNVGVLLAVAGFVCYVNFQAGGTEMVKQGMRGGIKFFVSITPLIIALAFMSGQIQAYYAKKPEVIRSITSGKSGIFRAAVLGTVLPGGIAAGNVFQSEWKNGGNKFAIVAFLISMTLTNWNTILIRLPFLGEKITAIIFGIGYAVTIVVVGILFLILHLRN